MSRGLFVSKHELDVQRARTALIQALECLILPTDEHKAAAILLIGLAVVRLAESDPDLRAHDLAVETVKNLKHGG